MAPADIAQGEFSDGLVELADLPELLPGRHPAVELDQDPLCLGAGIGGGTRLALVRISDHAGSPLSSFNRCSPAGTAGFACLIARTNSSASASWSSVRIRWACLKRGDRVTALRSSSVRANRPNSPWGPKSLSLKA